MHAGSKPRTSKVRERGILGKVSGPGRASLIEWGGESRDRETTEQEAQPRGQLAQASGPASTFWLNCLNPSEQHLHLV